jgi:hypothetical protein
LGLAVLLCACGGEEDDPRQPPADAGPPDTGPVDIPWLESGDPPIAPSPEHACPEGFSHELTDTGIVSCRPWPAGGPAACTGAEAHFPGEPGCARIGTACPAGDFPEGLPSNRPIVYVRSGATGGNGSLANPYGSVGYAVSVAPDGAVVAVAKGIYDGRVDLFSGVTVWGACPEATVLTQSEPVAMDTVVGAFVGDGELRNLTVRAPVTMGIFIDMGVAVRIEDVVVDGASGYGMYFTGEGTHVDVENVIVRDAAPFPDDTAGVGLQVIDGATSTALRVSIERSVHTQVVVAFGSVATFDRVVLRDATGEGGGIRPGLAMAVQEAGEATVTASGIWGNHAGGFLSALGSRLGLVDVAIEETGTAADQAAVSAALEVRVGSTLDASFVYVERAKGAAMLGGEDGALTASDLVVRDTVVAPDTLQAGMALSLEGTSQATFSRVLFEKSRRGGIVTMPGTRLFASDMVIRDTEGSGPRDLGLGMTLFGAENVIERARIERSTLEGVAVSTGATATLRDVVIRDTRGTPSSGIYGRGLEVNLGASLTGERILLERNHELSLFSFDPGSVAHITNLVIRDSLGQECGETCPGGAEYGYGVSARDGGRVELEGFVVTRGHLLGMQVGPGSSITGHRGEVSENRIGINVQEAAFDATHSLTDVVFRDNENDFDGTFVPLPDVGIGGS